MIPFAVGLGMVLSWLSFELIGFSAGGLVVPGYLSFFVTQPWRLLATFLLALAVVGLVRLADRYLVLFGRRRFMVTVLLGFSTGVFWRDSVAALVGPGEFYVVGLIVPGLLAFEMDRQGILPTSVLTLAIAVLVHLIVGLVV